ncbi:hypothetical protein LCGC14_1406950 [marine sediment metagenome]|uniref:Uncharacterized protein n=1 Tax=marine sediment metagenome TaxID=412755 RepID=A0A0F9KGD9_9ZZZZ
MTDDNVTPEFRKRLRQAASNHYRRNSITPYIVFDWLHAAFAQLKVRQYDGSSNLYLQLLAIAWEHGTLTKQGLPKITLQLKPLYRSAGVPRSTFQRWLQKLELYGLIKREPIIGDRINGNRTKIIIWAPKKVLEFLKEADHEREKPKFGTPIWGLNNETPGYLTTTTEDKDSSCDRSRDSNRSGVSTLRLQKQRLREKEEARRKSDGSDRQRQSKKPTTKYSQAGLIAWYRTQIRKHHGHNPTVNRQALRTRKWDRKKWKLVYEVLGTVIPQWDDFIQAQGTMIKAPPAYLPLTWINSWWNAFSGWHKKHGDMTTKKRKLPTSGRIVLK